MSFGNSLYEARKRSGLSQEEAAARLGVSRQTISKWELGETLPDIRQAKGLSALYKVTLDQLVDFDLEVREIEEAIERVSEETQRKVDWTKMWAQKYPVLGRYRQEVETGGYERELSGLLERLRREQGYSQEDAFLVLKDILAGIWTRQNS